MDAKSETTENQNPSPLSPELPGWNLEQMDYSTFRMTLIVKIMDRLTNRQFSQFDDLSYAEWRVLGRLSSLKDGGTVGQLAELAWVDRAEVSRSAASLESKGYSGRKRNSQDKRTPILFITDDGRQRYQSILAERQAFHRFLMSDLSEEECTMLDDMLARIGGRLNILLHGNED